MSSKEAQADLPSADSPKAAIPLATEGDKDDEQLLFEALEEQGYDISSLKEA